MRFKFIPAVLGAALGSVLSPAMAWQAECKINPMDDTQECQITDYDARILVFYGLAKNPAMICVIGHDFPGRLAAIRVDKNKMLAAEHEGCMSAGSLIEQMKAGRRVKVQYYEWPYDYPKYGEASLSGFEASLDKLRRLRGGKN